jgi:hypothetical protein
MPGQCVSLVGAARFRNDFIGESGQEEGPTGLTMCQGLFCGEVLEICMVREDFRHVFTPLEIVTKMAQHTDNGE